MRVWVQIPNIHVKSQVMWHASVRPVLGRQRQQLAGARRSAIPSKVQISLRERPRSQNIRWRALGEEPWRQSQTVAHTSTHMYVHTHPHMCTHPHEHMQTHECSDDLAKKTKKAREQRIETQYSQTETQKATGDNPSFVNDHFPPGMKSYQFFIFI